MTRLEELTLTMRQEKSKIQGYVNEELLLIAMKKASDKSVEKIIASYEKLVQLVEEYNLSRDFYYEYAGYLANHEFFSEALCIAEKLKNFYATQPTTSQYQKDQLDNFITNVELDLLLSNNVEAAASYVEDSLRWISSAIDGRSIRTRYEKLVKLAKKYNFNRDFEFGYVDFLVANNDKDEAFDVALSLRSYYSDKDSDKAKKAFSLLLTLA